MEIIYALFADPMISKDDGKIGRLLVAAIKGRLLTPPDNHRGRMR